MLIIEGQRKMNYQMRCPYFFSVSLVLCCLYKIHFIFSVPDIAAYLFYNLVAVFAAENIFFAGI